MASIINASSSGAGGLITTADASGILELQTAGTLAIKINATQAVGIGTDSPGAFPAKLSVIGDGVVCDREFNSRVSSALANAERGFMQVTDGTQQFQLYSPNGGGLVTTINGTEQARIDTAGLFKFNSGYGSVATAYGCRAWVNFNGTGTVAIRASGNVTSITDNGVGDYTVNFTTAMPDANYAISQGQPNVTTNTADARSLAIFNVATTSFRINNFADTALNYYTVHR